MGKPNVKDLIHGVGDEFSFETDEAMGFDDFRGETVRVEKLAGALGIKATAGYVTFTNLGDGASNRLFQKSFGLGFPKLEGVVVSGTISMISDNPGDYWEADGGTDTIPYTTDSETNDGIIVTFPTGKASLRDISTDEHKRLDSFVTRWSQRV
jgi:hypothetical protein